MRDDVQRLIGAMGEDADAGYARMYLSKLDGERKSLAPPKQHGISAERAKVVRSAIDNAMLVGVPVTVEPVPMIVPVEVPEDVDDRIVAAEAAIERLKLVRDPKVPERWSLSVMQAGEKCLLMAKFDRAYGQSSTFSDLGQVVHGVLDVLSLNAYREGWETYDPALAVHDAQEILGDPDESHPLSLASYDEALLQVEKWANKDTFWTNCELFLTEHLMEHRVLYQGVSYNVSGRLDRVEVRDGICKIRDYKTGMKFPAQADFEKSIQPLSYAWHMAWELGDMIRGFDLGELWTRWGHLLWYELPAEDLKMDSYLGIAASRLEKAWREGNMRATPGSHCANCPLPERCPIPPELRPDAAIATDPHAEAALGWILATEAQVAKVKKSLGGYVERTGKDVVTGDMRATRTFVSKADTDWEALKADAESKGLNVDQYRKSGGYTKFEIRKVQ